MTATENPEELVALYLTLEDQRVGIVETQNLIKKVLRDRYPLGRHKIGKNTISITTNRRFSGSVAALLLSEAELSAITVPTPNAGLARDLLDPDSYSACQAVVGVNKVWIK